MLDTTNLTADPRLFAFCGKGGVGKTTQAVATGIYLAEQGRKVCILDTDLGHSVPRALELPQENHLINILRPAGRNLDVVVIDQEVFVSVLDARENLGWPLERYLAQFPGDRGLIPWADMLNAFFGVPTDVSTVEKFVVIVSFLVSLEGYDDIIIDVEPTGGLSLLLSGADRMSNSLINLKRKNQFFLSVLKQAMPDVVAYLKGEYIQQAPYYTARLLRAVEMIRQALFFFVVTPEEEPVKQTAVVRSLIVKFGGQLAGCIVNRMRGGPYEEKYLQFLEDYGVPILRTREAEDMHSGPEGKRQGLVQIGQQVGDYFSLV